MFMTVAVTESFVMNKLLAIVALATATALTASPVIAAKHRAERPGVERPNRSNLYQSYAQGNQSYPNPDRELYLPD
jgi:hypothetical protein